jgi:hypothetical protein
MSWYRFLRLTVALSALIVIVPRAAAEQKPVPDRAAQQTAAERIKSVFSDEYKSTDRAVKAKFAAQLVELAGTEKEPVAKFTLYREAVRFASEAGDAATALRATDAMKENFAINPTSVKVYALSNVSKVTLSEEEAAVAADACAALVQELVAANEFAQAKTVVGYGLASLKRARDPQRLATLRDLGEGIDDIGRQYRAVAQHAAALKENPDDPAANLALGKFECFVKGNWREGLKYLSKGDDAGLKTLAGETLAAKDDAKEQFTIANGWWKQADTLDGVMKGRVLVYAGTYYEKALPGLTGLSKATAEKRLGEVPAVAGGIEIAPRQKTINLLELLDPAEDFKPKDKWAIANGVLQCTEGHFVPKVVFPYQPPEEYDITFAFAQPKVRNHIGVILPNPANNSHFNFKMGPREYGFGSDADKYVRKFPREIMQAGVKYVAVVSVRKDGVQATINGAAVAKIPTDFTDLNNNGWTRVDESEQIVIFCDDPTVFYQVQVTEVTGEGGMTRFPKSP